MKINRDKLFNILIISFALIVLILAVGIVSQAVDQVSNIADGSGGSTVTCSHEKTDTTIRDDNTIRHKVTVTCVDCGSVLSSTYEYHEWAADGSGCSICGRMCTHMLTKNIYLATHDGKHDAKVACELCGEVISSAIESCVMNDGGFCLLCQAACKHESTFESGDIVMCNNCGYELASATLCGYTFYFVEGITWGDFAFRVPQIGPYVLSRGVAGGITLYAAEGHGLYGDVYLDGIAVLQTDAIIPGASYA